MSDSALDINTTFCSGDRSVEFSDRINRASILMLARNRHRAARCGAAHRQGHPQVIKNESKDPAARRTSADDLDYEPRLIAVAGQEASRLHTGRSRQDASTLARMNLRDGLLQTMGALPARLR